MEFLENLLAKIAEFVASFGFRLLGAILVLAVGIFLIRWTCNLLVKSKSMQKTSKNAQTLIANIVKIALYIFLFFTVAIIIGVPAASIVAVIASAGLAIGLALQGGLTNIAGGIIILCFKPFELGDFIETASYSGTVIDIGLIYTTIKTPDNKKVVLPNGTVSNASVVDYSAYETRRLDLEFSVAYDSDIDMVKDTLTALASAHELVLKDPAPFVRLATHGESALIFKLRVWVKSADYWTVNFDLLEASKKVFDKRGIEIPFPQLDVHQK